MRLPWQSAAERYTELEELPTVLIPLQRTTTLMPEHFSTPLDHLRYPVKLDFSHERFQLRSLHLLTRLKDTALQEIDLSDNDLQGLSELNRFAALKVLCRHVCEKAEPSSAASWLETESRLAQKTREFAVRV